MIDTFAELFASVDSQSAKTTAVGRVRGYDGAKKVMGHKRQVIVDTLGLLLPVTVTAASVDDAAGVPPLVAQVASESAPRLTEVWADAKYHKYGLKSWLEKERPSWDLEVVSHPVGTGGFVLLPKRWIVERTFSWIDRCRHRSKGYEQRTDASEAMIKISQIGLMTRRLAPVNRLAKFDYRRSA